VPRPFSGGDVPNATYRNHGTHAEAIEIVFNPDETTYRDLLEFFFQIHDPTTLNRQGNDQGTSYRSAIFYTSDELRLYPRPYHCPKNDRREPATLSLSAITPPYGSKFE
jgi:methionine-S-sulfoxide reductase